MLGVFGATLPVAPAPVQNSELEKPSPEFGNLPSIVDMRLHEWVQKLTNSDGGVFPNGISPKQMEALANAQWASAIRAGVNVRPAWRGSNHLSALLSNEVRAGRLMRLQKACYIGYDPRRHQLVQASDPMIQIKPICSICRGRICGTRCLSLICKTCRIHVHSECTYNQRRMPLLLAAGSKKWMENWRCLNCKHCNICRRSDKKEGLLCHNCDALEHVKCQRTKHVESSFRLWCCSHCVQAQPKSISPISVPECPKLVMHQNEHHGIQLQSPEPQNHIAQLVDLNSKLAAKSPIQEKVEKALDLDRKASSPQIQTINSEDESLNSKSVKSWSVDKVAEFFVRLGFTDSASIFRREEVDGAALLLMERSDVFLRLGLKMGPALKTYKAIRRLQRKAVIEKSTHE